MKKFVILALLIMSVLITGCETSKTPKEDPPKTPAQVETPAPEKVKVTLYFANEQADALIPVEREIDKPNDMIVALIKELANSEKHSGVLPEGTELIFYQKEGDTIVLNFNREFANMQGTTGEFIAVNSVVNTITELPEFNKVQLLVECKPLTTGHAVYDKPLARNEGVIKK